MLAIVKILEFIFERLSGLEPLKMLDNYCLHYIQFSVNGIPMIPVKCLSFEFLYNCYYPCTLQVRL